MVMGSYEVILILDKTYPYSTTLTINDSSMQAIASFYMFRLATIYQLPTELRALDT